MTAGLSAPAHSIALENLQSYNGFYKRGNCRQVLYQLYAGVCQVSNEPVSLEDAHVAHIAPRSHAQFFESLYPGVDVDNLVNLHLVHKRFNLRVSDYFIASPMAIHNAISYSARLIQQRLPKILHSLSRSDSRQPDLEMLFAGLGTYCVKDNKPSIFYSAKELELIRVGRDFNLVVEYLSFANDQEFVVVPGTDHFSPVWDNGPFKSHLEMPSAVLCDGGNLGGCAELCEEIERQFPGKMLKGLEGLILRKSELQKSLKRCKKYFAQYVVAREALAA